MNLYWKIRKLFLFSVALLLFATAVAKIIAIAQHKKFLDVPDGVIPNVTILFSTVVAVVLEVIVAFGALLGGKTISLVAPLWLVFTFTTYRLTASALHVPHPCPCLGRMLDWSGLSNEMLDLIPILILAYIGVGCVVMLILNWWFANAHLKQFDSPKYE
jgi:hypothetical protein